MKIHLLGSRGQLGQCIIDQFIGTDCSLTYTSKNELDVTNFDATNKIIRDINPDILINATAYTQVDRSEDNIEEADLINNLAVANLAKICKELNCWIIHFSTDYVFDGKSKIPYKEDDKTNPLGVYGHTKLRGDESIIKSNCKYIILRTAWVYSEHGNNFLKTILKMSQTHKVLNIVKNQNGTPTYAQDIAKAILLIIKKIKVSNVKNGIYNFGGSMNCSWADFSSDIVDSAHKLNIISNKPEIIGINSREYPTRAKRPLQSQLNSDKIFSIFNIETSNYYNGIKSSLLAIKNNHE